MGPPPDHMRHDALSDETIHDLRVSLTIVKLQAQMVRRWLRTEDVAGAQAAITRLAVIDSLVERLSSHLEDFHEPPPQVERGAPKDGPSD